MRGVELTRQFQKDYRRELKNPNNRDLDDRFLLVVEYLKSDHPLPPRFEDHPLQGEYMDARSCHVKPDLVMIYMKIGEHKLKLIRLGSHSNLY
jgi:mRNA interferase YafQ